MTSDSQDPAFADERPTLRTKRLVLRPYVMADAPAVQRFAGAREIAATTETIPHPYGPGVAEEWIGKHARNFALRKTLSLAVTLASTGQYIGSMGLPLMREDYEHAELGYWIAKEYWNNGYCTEAARAMLRFGFTQLKLHRIFAHHFINNPASGRVLKKIGMKYEGRMREHVKKWGKFIDIDCYAILRSEADLSED